MRPRGEEEYQRFMGFPASFLSGRGDRRHADDRPPARARDGLAHPIVWIRWRMAVLRLGPYAPELDEFRRGRSGPA